MKKILAIVLVAAFVLGLGSVVLATENYGKVVDGWGSFYSRGDTEVEEITPILFNVSDAELWVAVNLKAGGEGDAGNVFVYNIDSTGGGETLIGTEEFDTETDDYDLVP